MNKVLNLLGLAKKAGRLEIGEEPTGAAARARDARLLLIICVTAEVLLVLCVLGFYTLQRLKPAPACTQDFPARRICLGKRWDARPAQWSR